MYGIQPIDKDCAKICKEIAHHSLKGIALNIHGAQLFISSNDPGIINRVREGYHFFEQKIPSPNNRNWFYMISMSRDSPKHAEIMKKILKTNNPPPYCIISPNYDKVYCIADYNNLNFLTGVFFTGEMVAKLNDDFIAIHGGGVSIDGVGVIFPAALRSGKTTLTLSCIYNGFKFSSDDVVLIHRKSLKIYPYPRLLSLRQESLYLVPGMYKDYNKLKPSDVFGEARWFLDKTSEVSEPFTCKIVAFPKIHQNKTQFDPISKADAALELIKHTFHPMTATRKFTNHKQDIETLSRFLENADTYLFHHWTPSKSLELLRKELA